MRIVLSAILLFAGCVLHAGEKYLLDGWRFAKGVHNGAEAAGYDDSAWERVRIPHDWAIAGPFDRSIDIQVIAVEQDGDTHARELTGRTAGLPWLGEGWYRRELVLPGGVGHAELVFDGAMSEATVFLDGRQVGYWPNGYNSFIVDISKFLKKEETKHVLSVRLRNEPESSRWYPGAGIYRPVRLVTGPRTGLVTWGTFAWTESLSAAGAVQALSSEVRLADKEDVRGLSVTWRMLEADGREAARAGSDVGPAGEASGGMVLSDPKAWSPETPYLYTLETSLLKDGKILESRRERIGVRTVSVGPAGFRLNGVKRKFQGVCLHHDLGPLGAAFNKSAFRRQVRLLKEMGCDSIRTAHNMPAPWQTEICDEEGMMVMAESFDMWMLPKCRNGYCRFFGGWAGKDIANLVRCHRNRPSVVMWSIGNEIPEQSFGATHICQTLQRMCRTHDPSRPVTQGMDRVKDAVRLGFVASMEVPGINYRVWSYPEIWTNSINGIVLGAETASTVSSRGVYRFPVTDEKEKMYSDGQLSSYDLTCCNWSNLPDDNFAAQDTYPWLIGEFVWSGFDYLGEPTPYKEYWPSRSSYFGMFDLAGLPKDRVWLYRSRWSKSSPTLHVLPHWTWPDRVGKNVPVYCYTSYPSAELFVNGKSQGRRTFDPSSRLDRYRLRWNDVVYEPGEIKVVAYDAEGRAVAEKTVRTAGKPYRLEVAADRTVLPSVASDSTPELAFVTVRAVDKEGNICPDADLQVDFGTSGAVAFKAACNGDATSLEVFVKPTMKLFHGQLVVLVEPRVAGNGILKVSAEGVSGAEVSFEVK
ncbi:MAG: DUF4982 domain-containing protein [Kiritimatiellae bacterium]|nr:DUF4982 domain-containing protein [Kiritimatiellia bacterium]